MSDRGMKKWAPFASLIEQSACLEEMRYKRNKIVKPTMSNEKAETINAILSTYHGQKLKIIYYYDGYLYELITTLKRVDTTFKKLVLIDGSIPFSEIVELIDLEEEYYF